MSYRDDDDTDIGGWNKRKQIERLAAKLCGHDGGFCNSRKAREYGEAEDEARRITNGRW